jgi:hypothetical protein
VSTTKVIKVKDLQLLLSNVLKNENRRIKNLEGEKKKVVEKLIGLWLIWRTTKQPRWKPKRLSVKLNRKLNIFDECI